MLHMRFLKVIELKWVVLLFCVLYIFSFSKKNIWWFSREYEKYTCRVRYISSYVVSVEMIIIITKIFISYISLEHIEDIMTSIDALLLIPLSFVIPHKTKM